MIRRESNPEKLKVIGFLIGAEVQMDEVDVEYLSERLADAISGVEGVGRVDIEVLGEMSVEDEEFEDEV